MTWFRKWLILIHRYLGIALGLLFVSWFVSGIGMMHAGVMTEPDQWTIGNRRQMPLHKIVANDDARTELYVSEPLSEVAVVTTRRSRAMAWVGAIPHWLYFIELRRNNSLWRQVILWTSGVGSVLALIGLVLGI